VNLRPPRNGHSPEFAESFRVQVEEALHQERIIGAYLNGERLSVSFLPEPEQLAAVEVVSLANALLETADRPSRLRILSFGENLEAERQVLRGECGATLEQLPGEDGDPERFR
jgi:hypothetical protein